jgi:glycosyltransferase involved in cell wall biosynthesis
VTPGRPFRIGIDGRYIQDDFPGIGRYTYNLAEALAKMGGPDQLVLFHNFALRNTRYEVRSLEAHRNLILHPNDISTKSLREQTGWWRLARNTQLDILLSPYFIKPYVLPCPSVVTIYDLLPMRFPSCLPSLRARLACTVALILSVVSARFVITVSIASKNDLCKSLRVDPSRVAVTYLAPGEQFTPALRSAQDRVRDRYSLPEYFALYVGINKPHKNLDTLVRAWAILKGRRPNLLEKVRLVLAGKEDYRYPQSRRLVAKLGLVDDVIFIGDIPDSELPALYSAATLFAFPSLYEGFGLPVLEAMACGTPVLCSNTSSLPEVAGEAAILLEPLAPEDWSNALERLLLDDEARRDMCSKGLDRAKVFSWSETARQTTAVLKEAIL